MGICQVYDRYMCLKRPTSSVASTTPCCTQDILHEVIRAESSPQWRSVKVEIGNICWSWSIVENAGLWLIMAYCRGQFWWIMCSNSWMQSKQINDCTAVCMHYVHLYAYLIPPQDGLQICQVEQEEQLVLVGGLAVNICELVFLQFSFRGAQFLVQAITFSSCAGDIEPPTARWRGGSFSMIFSGFQRCFTPDAPEFCQC